MITRNLTPSEYTGLALRTLSPFNPLREEYIESADGMMVNINVINHGAIGMATEGGENLDAVKKTLYYNKKLDRHNIIEECGDALWYIAITLFGAGSSIEEAMRTNINKLSSRYPEKFTEELAENRDLDTEREVIEAGSAATAVMNCGDDDEDEIEDDDDDDDDEIEDGSDIEDDDDEDDFDDSETIDDEFDDDEFDDDEDDIDDDEEDEDEDEDEDDAASDDEENE